MLEDDYFLAALEEELRNIQIDEDIEKLEAAERIRQLPSEYREQGGTKFGLACLRRRLEYLAAVRFPGRNNALSRTAYFLGGLAAAGELDGMETYRILMRVAQDMQLPYREAKLTVEKGMMDGARKPFRKPYEPGNI